MKRRDFWSASARPTKAPAKRASSVAGSKSHNNSPRHQWCLRTSMLDMDSQTSTDNKTWLRVLVLFWEMRDVILLSKMSAVNLTLCFYVLLLCHKLFKCTTYSVKPPQLTHNLHFNSRLWEMCWCHSCWFGQWVRHRTANSIYVYWKTISLQSVLSVACWVITENMRIFIPRRGIYCTWYPFRWHLLYCTNFTVQYKSKAG